MKIIRTVAELKSAITNLDESLPLSQGYKVTVTVMHGEKASGQWFYTPCYGANEDSTYGCCERARQIKNSKETSYGNVVRISSS